LGANRVLSDAFRQLPKLNGDRAAVTRPQVPPAPHFSCHRPNALPPWAFTQCGAAQPERAMPDRELRYKGYKIKLAPKQRGWRIRARPLSPDKPILSDHSFVVAEASEDEAIEQAKRRIDRVLAI
jgi:hypothetical protein